MSGTNEELAMLKFAGEWDLNQAKSHYKKLAFVPSGFSETLIPTVDEVDEVFADGYQQAIVDILHGRLGHAHANVIAEREVRTSRDTPVLQEAIQYRRLEQRVFGGKPKKLILKQTGPEKRFIRICVLSGKYTQEQAEKLWLTLSL